MYNYLYFNKVFYQLKKKKKKNETQLRVGLGLAIISKRTMQSN
jgi:hypothetical protein